MTRLIAYLSPVRYEHKISIIKDDDLIDTYTCRTDEIIGKVRELAEEFKVDEIAFAGSPNFVREYKDDYMRLANFDIFEVRPVVKIIQM